MKVEGEDYFNFFQDLITTHKNKCYKTAASFLLTKLCEKYDGLENYLVNFVLQLCDYIMSQSDTSKLPNYPLLQDPQVVEKFLSNTNFTPELLTDLSLLILAILNEKIQKSWSHITKIRVLFETYQHLNKSISSILLKDKLCLVYGLFLSDLYKESEVEDSQNAEKIFNFIEFIFVQILQFRENPGLAYQASNAITHLIDDTIYSPIILNIIQKLMPQLIDQIAEIEIILFFDVLKEIVLYVDVEQFLLPVTKQIVNRILKEVKTNRKPNTDKQGKDSEESRTNVYITKCFTILYAILGKHKLYSFPNNDNSNQDIQVIIEASTFQTESFEVLIEPLVVYLKNPKKIEFDDEIVELLSSLLKNTRIVDTFFQNIFPFLENYFNKNTVMTEELFELLNLYVMVDNSFLKEKEYLRSFIHMINMGLKENQEDENSAVYSCLLIQIWFYKVQDLPNEVVSALITQCVDELCDLYDIHKENLESLNNDHDVYIYLSYLTAIYAGLIHYPILVIRILIEKDMMSNFIEWTENMLLFNFFSMFQSKVILICYI
jgi:hypothetical protein